jgi:hypothetical protein
MPSRFLFHASAIGITGQITRPVTHPIPSVASALPPGGGYTNAKQDPGQLLEIYSHGGATTAVTGNEKNGDHETTATATVLNLNVGNVVLLDSCTAYLSSIHPGDGSQARFNTQGSFFKNLRIAGREIQLESRVDLHSMLATLDDLRTHYRNNTDFKGQLHFKEKFLFREQFLEEAFAGKENQLHPKHQKYFPWRNWTNPNELPVSKGGVCIVPLFIVKNPSEPGFHVCGNVITVDNFGTVVLGELIIGAYERRLTMLHAELGSPTGGMVSAAAVEGNGGGTDP